MLLHTPISQPEMIEYGFAVSPGTEAFLAVTPEMIHADEAIHGISWEKRGCYLEYEKSLEYFKHYSFLNCFMECSSNFTYKVQKVCKASKYFCDVLFFHFSDLWVCRLLYAKESQ